MVDLSGASESDTEGRAARPSIVRKALACIGRELVECELSACPKLPCPLPELQPGVAACMSCIEED